MITRLLACALSYTGFASVALESATITLQMDQPGIRISPSLYGLFHEDWAYAADGGLYPEMIRNRSFLYTDIPKYWSLLCTGEAKAFMATDGENTLNPNRERSLRLDVASLGNDGRADVVNHGYDGIALTKDAAYHLTAFTRVNPDFSGPLIARIEKPDGSAVFEYPLTGVHTEWKRFDTTFTSPATALDFRLVIEAEVRGNKVTGMLNGKVVHEVTLKQPQPHPKLFAGSSIDEETGDLFVKVINISSAPQETSIHLAGSPKTYSRATALTLSSNDPLAENTYAEPYKIASVNSTIPLPIGGASDFQHIFPQHSVTILKLKQ